MPWSEWQPPYTVELRGTATMLEWNTDTAGMPEGAVGYVSNADPRLFSYGMTINGNGDKLRDGVQFTKDPNWPAHRDEVPPALYSLTEGLDYDYIPGSAGQFVEYAPADNVWLGWEFPDGQTGSIVRGQDPDHPWLGEGSIGWQLDSSWPLDGWLYAEPSQDRVWALWTSYDPVPLPNPGNPGNVDAFTITVSYAPSGTVITGSAVATWYDVQPHMLVRLPSWRYWIPDTAIAYPLRQKQRNDGLARGVLRARSTSSIQNSVRQNSYR